MRRIYWLARAAVIGRAEISMLSKIDVEKWL
jgi:hypothetical protein